MEQLIRHLILLIPKEKFLSNLEGIAHTLFKGSELENIWKSVCKIHGVSEEDVKKIWETTSQKKIRYYDLDSLLKLVSDATPEIFRFFMNSYGTVEIDEANMEYDIHVYTEQKDALRYILDECMNIQKKSREGMCVYEQNNLLYNYWCIQDDDMKIISDPLYESSRYDELFENYTSEKPKSIEELEKYLAEGHEVRLNWADRAPLTVYTKKVSLLLHNFQVLQNKA